MEKREKSVIRANYTVIADDLIVNEDFYTALRQNKIFTDGMIANLKEEKTPRNEIYKMLRQLEKRGPDAFGNFIKVLEIAHPWLAEKLKADYQKRVQDSTIEDVPRQDYTTYSDERTSNTPRNPDVSTPLAVCSKTIIRKRKEHCSHSKSPNQIHKNADEQYSNRESQRAVASVYTQEVENTDNTDIQDKKNLNERTFADACVSPIQIVLPTPSAPMEAKDPNHYHSLLQNHSMSDDKADDIGEIIDNISVGKGTVFADNKIVCEDMTDEFISMAQIKKDDKVNEISVINNLYDNDNEEVQTARDIIDTKYNSMQRVLTQTTVNLEEPNLAEEGRDDKIPEQDYEPDNQQKKRIHAKVQSLLMTNHERPEQDRDQSYECHIESVTLDMIEDVVDSLHAKYTILLESQAKCFENVDTKDRKKALHICFKIQKDELIEIKEKLFEERKKVNDMANDMYNEMKNIEKLKETLKNTKCANIDLKNKLSDLEKSSLELHKKHQDLELSLKTKQESAVEDKPPIATATRKARRMTRDREFSPRKSLNPDSSKYAIFNTLTYQQGTYFNHKGRSNDLPSSFSSPRNTTATSRTTYGKKCNSK